MARSFAVRRDIAAVRRRPQPALPARRSVAGWPRNHRSEVNMPQIRPDFTGQTVITTFDVTPGTAHDLLDALTDAWEKVISRSPASWAARCI
jgi:hypothetical protein